MQTDVRHLMSKSSSLNIMLECLFWSEDCILINIELKIWHAIGVANTGSELKRAIDDDYYKMRKI